MFNDFFDFNDDGELDAFERTAEYIAYRQVTDDDEADSFESDFDDEW